MNIKQRVYQKIEIFEKESLENHFLLLYQNRTLSIGFLVKDILLFLQNGIFDSSEIQKKLLDKHDLVVQKRDIDRTIISLNQFAFEKTDSFFFKFGKLYIRKNQKYHLKKRDVPKDTKKSTFRWTFKLHLNPI